MAKQHLNITIDHDLVEFWDKVRPVYMARSAWLNALLREWKRTGREPGKKPNTVHTVTVSEFSDLEDGE